MLYQVVIGEFLFAIQVFPELEDVLGVFLRPVRQIRRGAEERYKEGLDYVTNPGRILMTAGTGAAVTEDIGQRRPVDDIRLFGGLFFTA